MNPKMGLERPGRGEVLEPEFLRGVGREERREGKQRRGRERWISSVNSYFLAGQKKKKIQDSILGNNFLSLLNTDWELLDYNKQDAVSVTVTKLCGDCFLI